MQHYAAFHQGLHILLRLKQPSGTEIHHNLETSTCGPLKLELGNSILILSIRLGKSIRIQRVNNARTHNIRLLYLRNKCIYSAQFTAIHASSKCYTFFFIFQPKTYVVGTQKNNLNEPVLLSIHNICLN